MLGQEQFYGRALRVLRDSRVFGSLDEAVLHDLAQLLERQDVPGGSMVFQEGAPAESMFFVLTGRLRVSRRSAESGLLLYNEIRSGDSVGEVGMVLQQPRTADVSAVRDSILAVLHRSHFETLLLRQPLAVNRVFSQAIFDQLRHTARVLQRHQAHAFVVLPLPGSTGAAEVARGLAQALGRLGRVHHVTPVAGAAEDRFDALEEAYDYLVLEADGGPSSPSSPSSWTRRALRQADQVVWVADAGASAVPSALELDLASQPGVQMKRQHLVLLHAATATQPQATGPWRVGRTLERIYPLRRQQDGDYARLARFLTGRAVGLVLGGGGARGFAHLGVLRALQEAKIPVDLVGGNSMGALIGAQYACGLPLDSIREQTRKFAEGGEWLTLPIISLVSGRRVARDLHRMFGDTQVDALWTPYFAAACNLTTARTTVQDSGPLWRAVLASNSPAGLFPPVLHQGQLLVDGAILENVPVDAMRMRLGVPLEKRRGNGTVIAIDVDVREDMGVDPRLQRLSVRSKLKGYFSRGAHSQPGIAEILYRAGHIGGLNQRATTRAQADHYLEPPVADFSLMAYRRADEIVEVGYRHAMEKIATWTQ
ncbi:lysophospholipid hydrolase [Rhodoferax sp. OV413]|uniref:cyclic nucleotide-binding and patatin-like phospholipase domain-containing protein n=1 Tax=Rhodoferax sp. OV413 TaxID=1855285 RepID=UPI00088AE9E3|nr:cyclic nucleotide-binding and patatin-like phospholipase domain-containing protein [Rhodoferax sp. OV413]SDP22308.1 lysophospholipid hydrolase [Rhodoferax sp. OV413]